MTNRTFLDADSLSLRLLANLGDAVYNLRVRERAIAVSATVDQMHRKVNALVNAKAQADALSELLTRLTEKELDIVKRARNLKSSNYKKTQQAIYRQSTAFEALVGHLHLSDPERLQELLLVLEELAEASSTPKP